MFQKRTFTFPTDRAQRIEVVRSGSQGRERTGQPAVHAVGNVLNESNKTRRAHTALWSVVLAVTTLATVTGAGVERAPMAQTDPVTFTKHIAPIIFNRCGGCHRPAGVAPFSLLTFSEV